MSLKKKHEFISYVAEMMQGSICNALSLVHSYISIFKTIDDALKLYM